MKIEEVEFQVAEVTHKFKIYHNMDDVRGISFEDALSNWMFRTNSFTPEGLCDYVRAKDPLATIFTEKEWETIMKD